MSTMENIPVKRNDKLTVESSRVMSIFLLLPFDEYHANIVSDLCALCQMRNTVFTVLR